LTGSNPGNGAKFKAKNDFMELLAEIWDKDVDVKKNSKIKYKVSWNKKITSKIDKDITGYYRGAARAVILNSKKEILLQHAIKNGYYKLPGGGIENEEDTIKALHREVLEETGYKIKVGKPIGLIIEHRLRFKVIQISYCYLAKTEGKKGKTKLEESEKQEGFQSEWWDIRKAVDMVQYGDKSFYQTKFIIRRDVIFIKKAIKLLYGND
jgi:8-oxo-dGTP pyrophosphatase MutT (NUDIX family)